MFDEVFDKNFKDKDDAPKFSFKLFIYLYEAYIGTQKKLQSSTIESWNSKIRPRIISFFHLQKDKEHNLIEENEDDNLMENIDNIDNKISNAAKSVENLKEILNNETEAKPSDKEKNDNFLLMTSLTNCSTINSSLISANFYDEEEIVNENIIYYTRDGRKAIQYLSTDLFLKKIIFSKFSVKEPKLTKGFIVQHSAFYKSEIIVQKVICAFYYYSQKASAEELKQIINLLNKIILEVYSSNNSITPIKEIYQNVVDFYVDISRNPEYQTIGTREIRNLLAEKEPSSYDIEFTKNILQKRKKSKVVSLKFSNSMVTHHKELKFRNYFSVLDWTTEDISRELAYLSKIQLTVVKPKEIIGARYLKKDKKITSPAVVKIIQRFDNLTFFVIEDILSYDYSKKRGKIIEKWIDIANACLSMKNFNDSLSIKSALEHYIVKGLKKTWKRVSSSYKGKLEAMNDIFNCEGNYKALREEIEKCKELKCPYIPYLGLLLKDVAFYEENMKYLKDNYLVNFQKIEAIQDLLDNFNCVNETAYNFKPVQKLDFFQCLTTKTEEELEALANQIEPKFQLYQHKKEEKRLTKVDHVFFSDRLGFGVIPLKRNSCLPLMKK